MNIFEFKAPGSKVHFYLDLEAIQIVTGLLYKEEPYVAMTDHGPGSGGVGGGHSSASFSVSMALRTDKMEVTHHGSCQSKEFKDELAFAKEHGIEVEKGNGITRHSPEIKRYAAHLNNLPLPFKAGREFKAEYERLIAAWKACPSRNK